MLGIIIQLLISWILAWFFEKRNLSVLGFRPTRERLMHFLIFFFITAAFCASGFFMKMYFANQEWKLNPRLSENLLLKGTWWNLRSVLFEELIFRGVLLYVLIKRIGATNAILISAAAFGIYHWFSFGVIGNPLQMSVVFITTGLMGAVLANAYVKTFSLYIPVAIHLGWNLTHIFIFSQGPIGDGLLIPADPKPFRTNSWPIFLAVTFLPMTGALLTNYLILAKWKTFKKPPGHRVNTPKEILSDSVK